MYASTVRWSAHIREMKSDVQDVRHNVRERDRRVGDGFVDVGSDEYASDAYAHT